LDDQNKEKREVTIRDVAELAGVSNATVGRVIGGYGNVTEKTIGKVLDAAKRLNYHPNAVAQSMKKKNTNTIGLIIANIQNPYFSAIVRAVDDTAVKYGWNVVIGNTDEDASKELSLLKTFYEKRLDGILISTAFNNDKKTDKLPEHLYQGAIPIVALDREIEGMELPVVKANHFTAAYQAVDHLIKLGHQRIGVIASGISITKQRIDGYKQALQDNGIPFDDSLIVDNVGGSTASINEGFHAARELMKEAANRPSAVIALSNLSTMGALLAFEELGLNIPEDVAVIGWDDFVLAPILKTPLTVVNQPVYEIGSLATEKLYQIINQDYDAQNRVTMLDTNLIIRKSCGYRG
jgi:DNA-binding LacI/PurR family transcriptional regulator